jgi:mono/diheme cytochrome c family protein
LAIRKRTTKSVAKRHDINYFKKLSPIRAWQWRLALVAVVFAVVWIGVSSWRSAEAFSSGPISSSHAIFAQQCATCHKPVMAGAGLLPVSWGRGKVSDSTCLGCHQVGGHHADVSNKSVPCSSCHIEHIGAMHLSAAPVKGCTDCHADLMTRGQEASIAAHIRSFTAGHPEFRALREASAETRAAAFGLKFNHAEHLAPGLTGPNGKVTLQCAYCHQVEPGRDPVVSGRMANVNFDRSCRSCHSLEFDRRVAQQAPHADAAAALKFVQEKMAVAAPHDSVALVRAQTILFRGKCSLCHTVSGASALPGPLPAAFETPRIAAAHAPDRFYSSAVFSHTVHGTVECTECHAAALTSSSGKDLLMPSITTCQRCHDGQSRPQGPALSAGHAESGCSLCHGYHLGDLQLAFSTYNTTHLVSAASISEAAR